MSLKSKLASPLRKKYLNVLFCEKILSSKRNLGEHTHKVHFVKRVTSSQGYGVFQEKEAMILKAKKVFCDKCDFSTDKIFNLKRHYQLHDIEMVKDLLKVIFIV